MAVDAFADRPQTNIQLYVRLQAAGRGADDLRQVRAAYRVAARIFAGQVRPEGRPFVCHLVGVAGILAALNEPVHVICAGLLHAALTQGDFGAGKGWVGGRPHRWLARAVGPQTLSLIDGYSRLAWNAPTICAWAAAGGITEGELRTLIVMRLANELDDALDDAAHFSRKGAQHRNALPANLVVRLARAAGEERLAAALETALADGPASRRFDQLREERHSSAVEAPLSFRRRLFRPLAYRVCDLVGRAGRRLGRLSNRAL